MGDRSPDKLVVAEANRDAARLLTGWRSWPNGGLALAGPGGSGKTHHALAWALEVGARQLSPTASAEDAAAPPGPAAPRRHPIAPAPDVRPAAQPRRDPEPAHAGRGAVLLVGAEPPSAWAVELPDLRSRLASLPVARLGEPDEVLMDVVLRRICREQFIQLSDDAAHYLARRLPRTFAAARRLAAALDADLVRGAKPVAVAVARRALEKAQASWGEAGDG
jgi:chromosomal replication initiation ATPase DnaA